MTFTTSTMTKLTELNKILIVIRLKEDVPAYEKYIYSGITIIVEVINDNIDKRKKRHFMEERSIVEEVIHKGKIHHQ